MSTTDVGELFGEEGSTAQPKITRVIIVLVTGMTLTVVGMACTAVPGGLITLIAWALAEKELGKVDSGFLPIESRPSLVALRLAVLVCLALVLLLFILQGILLCSGVYFTAWTAAIEMLRPVVLQPVPPT